EAKSAICVEELHSASWHFLSYPFIRSPLVAALDAAGFAEAFAERSDTARIGRAVADESDDRHRRLLRARGERPPGHCAAEQLDERAALHHSIISSAMASNLSGISMLSALAVLRLITSLYLVGACTGRSAGFSPFRMRST